MNRNLIVSVQASKDALDQLVVDGDVVPGFSGIGRLRGRTDYTENEKTVLQYFFTRIDSNVYAVKDTMPDEMWALVMGQYARSNLTLKDRLLKLFNDVHRDAAKEGISVPTADDLADIIRKGEDIYEMLDQHNKASSRWIARWGIKHGHASLRDSAVIRLCFEGVSQRATKFLEAAREGAYQEQSTRALETLIENAGIPFEIRGTRYEKVLISLNKRAMSLYNRTLELLKPHLKIKFYYLRQEADARIMAATNNPAKKITDKEWEGVIGAKAFDVARNLLNQNMTTSLGITLNARRTLDMLTEWQSSPFSELQLLGRAAQIEALKVSSEMMKYGNRSEYYAALPGRRRESFREFINVPKLHYGQEKVSTRLIAVTPGIEDLVIASILFNGNSGMAFEDILGQTKSLSPEVRQMIARRELEGRKTHEPFPKTLEIGTFTFKRRYDIGAYRDLQRQRGDLQQCAPYNVIGFMMPLEFSEVGLEQEYLDYMKEVKIAVRAFKDAGLTYVSEYLLAMGNLVEQCVTKDPAQCFYEAQLRTQPGGIDSYRFIEQQEHSITIEHLPAFASLAPCDYRHYPLGRLEEVIKTKTSEQAND